MRKTIGLKLTDKEERIVNQLNKNGITNSELLRDALWFYFKSLTQPVESTEDKKVNAVNLMIKDHIGPLTDKINQLHEQDGRFQDYVKAELSSLHSRMSQIDKDFELAMQMPDDETNYITDVHNKIDEAINKRTILRKG